MTTTTLTCGTCGSAEEAGARFCGNCGAELATGALAQVDGSAHPTCRSCGASADPSAPFCGNCGATLDPEPATLAVDEPIRLICQSCGAAEDPSALFCGECGASLDAAQEKIESVSEPAPLPAAAQPTRRRSVANLGSRRRWIVAAAVGLLVLAAGAAFLLLGGNESDTEPRNASTLDDRAFWEAANSAIGGLTAANLQAQTDLALSLPTGTEDQLYRDGSTIVSSADSAGDGLRALANLSPAQVAYRDALLAFLAANGRYGSTVQEYALQFGDFGEVQTAAGEAAVAHTAATSALPPEAQLPSSSLFTLSAPQEPEETPTPAPAPAPPPSEPQPSATDYVNDIDGLLRASQQTRQHVIAFVPSVLRGEISGPDAITQAEAFTADREQALERVLASQPPAEFARAQRLLVQSLRLSIADDRALVAWAKVRNNGGDGQGELERVNDIGAQASAVKRRFLALYGRLRQTATGKAPSTLPDGY